MLGILIGAWKKYHPIKMDSPPGALVKYKAVSGI